MAKDFRLEAWIQPLDPDEWYGEDEMEQRIKSKLRDLGLTCQGGPVVFRIYPNGSDPNP